MRRRWTFLPSIFLMMTAFTRIVIVLSILRQAIGAGQAPANRYSSVFPVPHFFVMAPVMSEINVAACSVHGRDDRNTDALQRAPDAKTSCSVKQPGGAISRPSCAFRW